MHKIPAVSQSFPADKLHRPRNLRCGQGPAARFRKLSLIEQLVAGTEALSGNDRQDILLIMVISFDDAV